MRIKEKEGINPEGKYRNENVIGSRGKRNLLARIYERKKWRE